MKAPKTKNDRIYAGYVRHLPAFLIGKWEREATSPDNMSLWLTLQYEIIGNILIIPSLNTTDFTFP